MLDLKKWNTGDVYTFNLAKLENLVEWLEWIKTEEEQLGVLKKVNFILTTWPKR